MYFPIAVKSDPRLKHSRFHEFWQRHDDGDVRDHAQWIVLDAAHAHLFALSSASDAIFDTLKEIQSVIDEHVKSDELRRIATTCAEREVGIGGYGPEEWMPWSIIDLQLEKGQLQKAVKNEAVTEFYFHHNRSFHPVCFDHLTDCWFDVADN